MDLMSLLSEKLGNKEIKHIQMTQEDVRLNVLVENMILFTEKSRPHQGIIGEKLIQ